MIKKIVFYIGAFIFMLGLSMGDSDCLIIPFSISILGFVICYINRGAISLDDFDDDDDNF